MKKKICYVLTGGSLAGICAQTAALTVLEEYVNLEDIEGIVGTSAGSLSGAFYASGMHPADMVKMFSKMKKSDYVDPNWFKLIASGFLLGRGLTGILEGKHLYAWLQKNLPVKNIQETIIPLAINVTNVSKQVPEVLRRGDLAGAVRASTSIPFVFKPHQMGDSLYVDGGAVNNIPLDEAVRQFPNADAYIIITTLNTAMTEDRPDNSWVRKPLAPMFLLMRTLHACARELSLDNMNASGKPYVVINVNPGPIDLTQVEKFTEAFTTALKDVTRKIPLALSQIGYSKGL